jgi:hypothetical protein
LKIKWGHSAYSRYLNTFSDRPVASRKTNSIAKAIVIITTRIQIRPGAVSAVCHSSVTNAARQSATPISENTAADPAADADGRRFPVADFLWFDATRNETPRSGGTWAFSCPIPYAVLYKERITDP